MHYTLSQSFGAISTLAAAWLMVKAGVAKRGLVVKAPKRCAACGRRRDRRACRCGNGA
jgi:hypothetical protein